MCSAGQDVIKESLSFCHHLSRQNSLNKVQCWSEKCDTEKEKKTHTLKNISFMTLVTFRTKTRLAREVIKLKAISVTAAELRYV